MSDKRGGDQTPASPPSDPSAAALLRQAGAAHDINQMLAVILGRTELLLMREERGLWRDDLEAVALAARDAAAMVTRLQRGLPPDPSDEPASSVNLQEAVRSVALLIRPRGTGSWAEAAEKNAAGTWVLETSVPENLFTTVPGQVVREVLSNLLVNALEVLPGGGRISIEATYDAERVRLRVTDDGPGLDKDIAARIFEPGFSSSGEAGRGIGLAGSRQLLKCFDGRLDLGPRPEIGARFELDLPRGEGILPADGEKNFPQGEPGDRPQGFPVLVVDDEPGVRDMLGDVLAELDCRVNSFRDASGALEGFQPGAYGLALLDQTLPGLSGLELALRLRERDRSLVIVLISGWGQEELLATADPASVDLTASKPLEWARLSEILDQGSRLYQKRRTTGSP